MKPPLSACLETTDFQEIRLHRGLIEVEKKFDASGGGCEWR